MNRHGPPLQGAGPHSQKVFTCAVSTCIFQLLCQVLQYMSGRLTTTMASLFLTPIYGGSGGAVVIDVPSVEGHSS